MPASEVLEFARLLIEHVRDMAIGGCDISISPGARDVRALRWQKKMKSVGTREFAHEIIPDCVDETLFYLLHAIDEGLLEISFKTASGKVVNLTKIGDSEMAGHFMGTDGWREAYSKERFNDDFADIV